MATKRKRKPLTAAQREQLCGFALDVLAILERDEDWGADTIDSIGLDAMAYGLGVHSPRTGGLFKVAPAYRGHTS